MLDANGNVTAAGTVAMATPFAMRNKIINGAMEIDQRNAGAAQTVTTASAYSLDRWKIIPFGASVTSQQVSSGVTGTPYVLQITGASSVTGVYIQQRIESYNIADLAGKTVTLSFKTSNSLLTTLNWYVNYANSKDNFSSSTGIASGSKTITSTLTDYFVTFALPANAENGVEITLWVAAQTSGTWKLTNVQLEVGSVATPFERRLYTTELQLAQRYYQRIGDSSAIVFAVYSTSGNDGYQTYTLQQEMRTSPTTARVGTWTVSNGGQPVFSASPKMFRVTQKVTATGSAFSNAGTGMYATFDAEL